MKDLELKRSIVSQLALMNDKAATDYMMELLSKPQLRSSQINIDANPRTLAVGIHMSAATTLTALRARDTSLPMRYGLCSRISFVSLIASRECSAPLVLTDRKSVV